MASQQTSRNSSYATTAAATTVSYRYMTVIPIEDDDLTFGGKPLSDWHEEDRYRYSSESADEMRGRTRSRPHESSHHKHGHKHHHKKSDKK
ncbi:hypothetical protein N0V82_007159 [Gnomoniopsis sp. IMI 355080]|nr:hypothetical protein N0V82_007159 [Gnomoniopsis sp. IMI 355080]